MKHKFFYLIFSVAILFGIGCIQIESHEHSGSSENTQLEIKNFSANVHQINANLAADDIDVIGDTKGETYVTVRVNGDGVKSLSAGALQQRVDKYYDLKIAEDGSGTLQIEVDQKFNNISSSNSLSFFFGIHTSANTSVQIKNVSGDIKLANLSNADISSVSGDIDMSNISGKATASNTSGDIKGDNIATIGDFSSVSGDITLKVNDLSGDINLESTSGSIHLNIPSEIAANIDFASTSGDVNVNNIKATSFSKQSDNILTGILNGGGKTIKARTISGDIKIN